MGQLKTVLPWQGVIPRQGSIARGPSGLSADGPVPVIDPGAATGYAGHLVPASVQPASAALAGAADGMGEQLAETCVLDDTQRAFLHRSIPWALRGMAERLLEAAGGGLWEQPSSPTVDELRYVYLQAEGVAMHEPVEPPEPAPAGNGRRSAIQLQPAESR